MKYIKTFETLSVEDRHQLRNTVSRNRWKVTDDYVKNHPLTLQNYLGKEPTYHLKKVRFDNFDSDQPSDYLNINLEFEDDRRNSYWIGVQRDTGKKGQMPKWSSHVSLPTYVINGDEILDWVDRFLIGRVSDKEKSNILMYMKKELDERVNNENY